ncbi:uncharacterized protein LOC142524249 isoform X2 [Primulina tabacum]|uniref:uncharacterized protein LOC142524249 isoform X2 n=1 Tax=Primulina tabacum TaxID=48773 RepID=UPI003F59F7D3
MDGITLSKTSRPNYSSALQFFPQLFSSANKSRILSFSPTKPKKFSIFASKDEPRLHEWDEMELKFGKMIGEDPKITLAKIMGRKSNPDMTYLEIEKLLDKKKGKTSNDEIEELHFDASEGKNLTKSVQGLNLVRPVPKRGAKFQTTDKPVELDNKKSNEPYKTGTKESKSNVPDVILRKPKPFNEDDGDEKYSRFGMNPNLTLKMWKEPQKERFSDITLLKKPEMTINPDGLEGTDTSGSGDAKSIVMDGTEDTILEPSVLSQKPELMHFNSKDEQEHKTSEEYSEPSSSDVDAEDKSLISNSFSASAAESRSNMWSDGKISSDGASQSTRATSANTVLIGKPKRLDVPWKAENQKIQKERVPLNVENLGNSVELENFISNSPVKEREDDDWARAEELLKTGHREEVELISSSTRGFVVSFGSLIGFLPYRNLAARWKFLAFESWLRRKGVNPSIYRQNLGVIGNSESTSLSDSSESGDSEIDHKGSRAISSDMKLEELLMIYDQEKLKFLSSFVGQKIKVGVVLVDRNSRRLIFSIKQKEKEELVEKKRSLMAQLSVGDVVKCCIKKITYFGVFVEVEGVPALIHQSEVSWDATLDHESYFKVGQIIDAKVHQLDFLLERIFLSLKEITPDPLIEALEAVVGDHDSLGDELEAVQENSEWTDVESLIKELLQFEGIQSVSKGRYFLSPGLAPTFQVYMASMFENQYKLLARAGNRVQEVIVETSLDKEELKSAILTSTNRVE